MGDIWVPEQIDRISVSRVRRSADYVVDESHEHPYYEIYYLISGKCKMFFHQDLYYLNPGDIMVFQPHEIHRCIYENGVQAERFVVYFMWEHVRELWASCGREAFARIFADPRRSLPEPYRSEAGELFRQLLAEEGKGDAFTRMEQKCLLYRLLAFLGRRPAGQRRREDLKESEAAVLESVRYLSEHRREPVTLDQAAEVAHMSPTYFSKKFRQSTGFGFKEYLNYLRVQEAADLLCATDGTITDIALACGFSDGNYFGDVFKKAKGVSPRQYRNAYKGRKEK